MAIERFLGDEMPANHWIDVEERSNIWLFNYSVAKFCMAVITDFIEVADIYPTMRAERPLLDFELKPNQVSWLLKSGLEGLNRVVRHYETNCGYDSYDDNIEWARPYLHELFSVLPLVNSSSFPINGRKVEKAKRETFYSIEEISNPMHLIAKNILPLLTLFSDVTMFPARFFTNMYPINEEKHRKWKQTVKRMVEGWTYFAEHPEHPASYTDIPEKIREDINLFAEYLPEMQND